MKGQNNNHSNVPKSMMLWLIDDNRITEIPLPIHNVHSLMVVTKSLLPFKAQLGLHSERHKLENTEFKNSSPMFNVDFKRVMLGSEVT